MNDRVLLPKEPLTLQLATQGLCLGQMNPLKCEQYFYLLLSGKEKFRSSEGNQGSREKFNYTSFSPPPKTTWTLPGWVLEVWVPMHRAVLGGQQTPLSPDNHSLLISDRQPNPFCEENEWTTYEKINCFSRTSISGKGWFSCPQTTLFLRLLGCLWVVGKNILGVRYMVWSLLLLIHFLFPAPAQGAWLWNQGATKLTHIAVVTLVNYTY